MSNTFTRFIDSCVGAIARKVQDEFDESKHPRDKGGRFSSKGGEGRGAGTSEYDGMDRDEMEQLRSEAMRKQEREPYGSDKFHEYQKQISELTKHINRAKKSEGDPLPDTDFEKEAKKEIGSGKESGSEGDDDENDVREELIQVKRAAKAAKRFKSSGIDLASAMEDLDIPTEGVPEKYLESVFEGSLSEDPKLLRKAEDYIERYESGELEKEADRLGSEEDDDDPYEKDYEEGTSTTNLYGDKKQAPAVINALQHYYNGDSKAVGNIIRQINSITTNPEVWGEYPVSEIIDDIEDRYGELDQRTKDNIAVYLSKTAPSYWDPEVEYWKEKNKKHPGPKEPAFYE